MSNFFKTSDGQDASKTGKEFDAGGGDFAPIPAKTQVLFAPDQVKWEVAKEDGEASPLAEHISIRWAILQPEEYKNRKIFQKVKVKDAETKVSDKAKRMLAAIDANAGGGLAKLDHQPSDAELAKHLVNKPMIGLIQEYKFFEKDRNGNLILDDDGKKIVANHGNWVSKISPKKSAQKKPAAQKPNEDKKEEPVSDDFDDDIPF